MHKTYYIQYLYFHLLNLLLNPLFVNIQKIYYIPNLQSFDSCLFDLTHTTFTLFITLFLTTYPYIYNMRNNMYFKICIYIYIYIWSCSYHIPSAMHQWSSCFINIFFLYFNIIVKFG